MGLFTESLQKTDLERLTSLLTDFKIKFEQTHVKEPLKEVVPPRTMEKDTWGSWTNTTKYIDVLPEYIRVDPDPSGHATIVFYFDVAGKYHSSYGYEV